MMKDKVPPLLRRGQDILVLDQLELPHRILYRRCRTPAEVAGAIRRMILRGAPLIGCSAAYGYAFAARTERKDTPRRLEGAARLLLESRPTAVNLRHAIERMRRKAASHRGRGLFRALLAEADALAREDLEGNMRMARFGAALLPRGSTVMTHCNAGALATAGVGTAVGVIRWGFRTGRVRHVYACETRPYLQGSRLTLWELMQDRIPCTLITDNMAAHIMKTEKVHAVVVGADRIAANADAANKIGTYGLAILAKHHGIPFYIAAPSTTVDFSTPEGSRIPIEERSVEEVVRIRGRSIAPARAKARHPAFDVTPHELITAIVTERGVVRPADGKALRRIVG
jgi:methylthioribose-1-phosphate isomerase